MILHIPHASRRIPADVRQSFRLSEAELELELLRMTDAWTVELFAPEKRPDVETVVHDVSRLVVDPERFEDDAQEPMALKGMGVVYQKTASGTRLRDNLSAAERSALVERYYRPHHRDLEQAVERELTKAGIALIVDCHSFPSKSLPYEDQTLARPKICIGTDEFHTPVWLRDNSTRSFMNRGYDVALNTPFKGSIVPQRWYRSDPSVHTIMIEVRRDLYMNEATGVRLPAFDRIRDDLQGVLSSLSEISPS